MLSMNDNSSKSKKPKTSSTDQNEETSAWNQVIEYIRLCPHVSSSHPAIQAAIAGVEKERARQERDRRLQKTFAAAATSTNANSTGNSSTLSSNQVGGEEEDVVMVEQEKREHTPQNLASASKTAAPDKGGEEEEEEDSWQSIDHNNSNPLAVLGQELAPQVVQLLSQNNVQVSHVTAALTMAGHAALLAWGWKCLGVPEAEPVQGFAPPIRPTFLPANYQTLWKNPKYPIELRYRTKEEGGAGGSFTCHVEPVFHSSNEAAKGTLANNHTDDPEWIQITWWMGASHSRSTRSDEPTVTLKVSVQEYFNLDSWHKAQRASSGNPNISPVLHYKALGQFLQTLLQPLDLGNGGHEGESVNASATGETTTMAATTISPPQPVLRNVSTQPPLTNGNNREMPFNDGRGYEIPTSLNEAFPGLYSINRPGGDFSGDLFPGTGSGGNLMGPNHPQFFVDGHPNHDQFLRPRFDPTGPPPTQPDPGDPRQPQRSRVPGGPNPDHLRPPNNLNNNNMFM